MTRGHLQGQSYQSDRSKLAGPDDVVVVAVAIVVVVVVGDTQAHDPPQKHDDTIISDGNTL